MRGARKSRWWRRLWLAVVGLALLVGGILLALPWWLPWGLRVIGSRFGLSFAGYERDGYGAFVLRDLRWETPGMVLTAERVGTRNPLLLLGRNNWLEVSGWTFAGRPSGRAPSPTAPDSTGELLDEIVRQGALLQRWLARAELGAGRVILDGQVHEVPLVQWENGVLRARVRPAELGQPVAIHLDSTRGELRVAVEPWDLLVQAQLGRTAQQWQVAGWMDWAGNRADWSVTFGPNQWLPTQARFQADQVRVAAGQLPVAGVGQLRGALAAHWDGDSYQLQLAARTDQYRAELSAHGDLAQVWLDRLLLVAPLGQAVLSEPVQVWFDPLRFTPAELRIAAEVPELPWGKIQGGLQVDAQQARLRLAGSNLTLVARYDLATQRHEGELVVERWQLPPLQPLAVQARWQGQGLEHWQASLVATGGLSRLSITAAWRERVLVLTELTLGRAGELAYALVEPVEILLANEWVRVSRLQWVSPQGRIELAGAMNWPVAGDWRMRWRQVECGVFCDLVAVPLEEFQVAALDLAVSWDHGPAVLDLAAQGTLVPSNLPPLRVSSRVQTEGERLRVRAALGTDAAERVLELEGWVPLVLQPAQAPKLWQLRPAEPMQLSVQIGSSEVFWRRVARATGVLLHAPLVSLEVGGTPAQPSGQLTLRAQALEWTAPTSIAWPAIGPLAADLTIGEQALALESLRFSVEGQAVQLGAQLPMDSARWEALVQRGQWPGWRQLEARLEVANAELAPLARFWPTLLAPQGRLAADLALRPGLRLHGGVALVGAATRPLPPIGPIDQIRSRISFFGRLAEIEEFSGRLGGQPVNVTGRIRLPERTRATYDLRLSGEAMPIVREPGLLVRADVDLRFQQGPEQPPLLSGELRLQDSLFLRELELLAPGQLAQVQRRPPYFSIEAEPLADWRLDVQVHGKQFLQVRSPVFRGLASADFELEGTLADPLAIGTIKLEGGTIKFPFTDFRIDQGTVSLSREQPYRPQLSITANARSFGYDLRLDLGGTADAPLMIFSSTPPLSSEEILMMVTAGQLPRGEYEFTTGEKASRLALFLGRDLLRKFGAETGAAERLTIRSGEDITEQGGLTYYLEYQLSDRWSVFAEQDRFDQYNVGVRWRVFSR